MLTVANIQRRYAGTQGAQAGARVAVARSGRKTLNLAKVLTSRRGVADICARLGVFIAAVGRAHER